MGAPTKLVRKTTLVPQDSNHLPVYTLTFQIPRDHKFSGRAQPLQNVRIDMGDVVKMVIPNYKPKSYSMSALREEEGEFDVTLKVYPNGRASGYLDRLKVGSVTNAFGMRSGRTRNPGRFFGAVAYGVGITEILPVAAAELAKGDAEKVVVLWANRTMGDTFWHDRIKHLEEKYGDRFEMVYILSREDPPPRMLQGRINPTVLQSVFEPRLAEAKIDRKDARFLAVGTKEMIYETGQMFGSIGFPMSRHELLPK